MAFWGFGVATSPRVFACSFFPPAHIALAQQSQGFRKRWMVGALRVSACRSHTAVGGPTTLWVHCRFTVGPPPFLHRRGSSSAQPGRRSRPSTRRGPGGWRRTRPAPRPGRTSGAAVRPDGTGTRWLARPVQHGIVIAGLVCGTRALVSFHCAPFFPVFFFENGKVQ